MYTALYIDEATDSRRIRFNINKYETFITNPNKSSE